MKSVKDFKYLERYKQIFTVTPNTVFAYDNEIYCDTEVPLDILVHESKHIERQNKVGADYWVEKYLVDPNFRLEEEVLAYRQQLQAFTDRNERYKVKLECAKTLSSGLYGNIITYEQALKLL